MISDNCVTREGSVIAEESQLYLIEILERYLKMSHRHRPCMLGTLLVMIPELRVIGYIFYHEFNLRMNQLLDIWDALPSNMRGTLLPGGRAYELLSDDMIKRICEDVGRNKRKTRKKRTSCSQKKRRKKELTRPTIENFSFFIPPVFNHNRRNIPNFAWSLRSDVWFPTNENSNGEDAN